MRKNRHRLFLAIFVVFILSLLIVPLVPPSPPAKEHPVVSRLISQMFPIFIAKKEGATVDIRVQGTGILIEETQGNLVTAKHVVAHLEENPGYTLYAKIDGTLYPLKIIWEHGVADIAVVQFLQEGKPTLLPHALPLAKNLPQIGEKAKLFGYLEQRDRSKLRACEDQGKRFVCEKAVTLIIEFVNASGDFFYDGYDGDTIASPSEKSAGKEYYGMSGGALVNSTQEMVGIFVSFDDERMNFVSVHEIPDEYLQHPSP